MRISLVAWNKGLTKELDERVKINSERSGKTLKRLYKEKKLTPWWIKKGLQNPMLNSEVIKKMIKSKVGKKHSKEHKQKISESMKRYTKTDEHLKNNLRRRGMSRLEVRFNNLIKQLNLPYKFVGNGKFLIERKCPDFINCNGKKVAIEVFCRRHKGWFRGNVEEWKNNRQKIFSKYGWKIHFFNELQINEIEILRRLG